MDGLRISCSASSSLRSGPDLEEEKSRLIIEAAETAALKEVEDRILHTLSSSEGNILDDQSAIDVLTSAKKISDDVAAKQVIADDEPERLTRRERATSPDGAYNSVLFFTIRDGEHRPDVPVLALSVVPSALRAQHPRREKPSTNSRPSCRTSSRRTRSRALQQRLPIPALREDQLLFSFLLDCRIMGSEDRLPPDEFSFFLTGGVGVAPKSAPRPEGEEWCSPKMWDEITRLASVCPAFASLPDDIAKDLAGWRHTSVVRYGAAAHQGHLFQGDRVRSSPRSSCCS